MKIICLINEYVGVSKLKKKVLDAVLDIQEDSKEGILRF